MQLLLSTVLIFHFCQSCEIEWSDSKLPLVTEADIEDFDGTFTVSWAHLVKHPQSCTATVMVTINHRTAVLKRCSNCENAPRGKHGAKYIAPITVSLKADSESV